MVAAISGASARGISSGDISTRASLSWGRTRNWRNPSARKAASPRATSPRRSGVTSVPYGKREARQAEAEPLRRGKHARPPWIRKTGIRTPAAGRPRINRFVGCRGQISRVSAARERDDERRNLGEAGEQEIFFFLRGQNVALCITNMNELFHLSAEYISECGLHRRLR